MADSSNHYFCGTPFLRISKMKLYPLELAVFLPLKTERIYLSSHRISEHNKIMGDQRKYPTGIQTFTKLREENYLYIL